MADPCNIDPPRPRALCPGCNDLVPVVGDVYWPHYATRIEQLPPLQVVVDLWPCEGSGLPIRECRVCGCTELDCTSCVIKTGAPCSWVEDDLCSACHVPGQHVRVVDALRADGTPNLNGDVFFIGFEDDGAGGVRAVDKEDDDADARKRR